MIDMKLARKVRKPTPTQPAMRSLATRLTQSSPLIRWSAAHRGHAFGCSRPRKVNVCLRLRLAADAAPARAAHQAGDPGWSGGTANRLKTVAVEMPPMIPQIAPAQGEALVRSSCCVGSGTLDCFEAALLA